ncbi:MAG: 4Fe-4S binding protein [Christensenellales bacterium]
MANNSFGWFQGGKATVKAEGSKEKTLFVNPLKCPQNHPCPSVRVCPVGALSQTGYHAPEVDGDKCIKCGKCVQFCPRRAISLG